MGRRIYRDIEIRGVTYPDANAASQALGVSADTVRLAARNGMLHRCGLGRVGVEPMSIRIGNKVFPDAAAAAKHFKVGRTAIYKAIENGDPDRIGRPRVYNGARSKPFQVCGLRFRSRREASLKLGFGAGYVSHALHRNSAHAKERIIAAAMAYAITQEQRGCLAR